MKRASQAGHRSWPLQAHGGMAGMLPVLLCMAACSIELSPEQRLLSARVAVTDSLPRELKVEAPMDLPVLITVSGRAVDVRVAAMTDTSRAAIFADAPNRRMGVETLLIAAPHPRVIEVRIERNDHSEARGQADVLAVALPLKTKADRQRFKAARLDAKGCLAYPNTAKGQDGIEAFTQAAQLHADSGNRLSEGLSRLHAAGARYSRLADWAGAAATASQATSALERVDASEYAAMALRIEGAALDQNANASGVDPKTRERDLRQSRARLTDAFERFQKLGNRYEAGYALNYRGVSYDVAGDREQAREDFQAALGLFKSANDRPAQALSLQSLALQSHQDGRLSDAMREFDEALALIPRNEDPENYAHTLHNSAWPFRAVGRFDESIARFHEAGKILRLRGDRDGEARALHGLGTTLMYAGEPQRAAELLRAAIRLRGETGARREQALSLLALGELEREFGEIDLAIDHGKQALALVSAPHDLAQASLVLARAYIAADRLPQAREELQRLLQLQLPPSHRYLGLALAELGDLESMAGRNEVSRDYFARAIAMLGDNGSDLEHARTLVRRAKAELRMGDATSAIADTRTATAELEAIGLQSLQAESRAAFRASFRDAAEIQIAALLTNAGNQASTQPLLHSALAVSDYSRAQMLAEAEPIPALSTQREALVRRRELYELLAGKRLQRERLLNAAQPDENCVAELTREIERLRTEVSLVDRHISTSKGNVVARTSSGKDASLVAMVPASTIVAEFFIGQDHAWLFEVRRGQVEIHTLATGPEIDKLARGMYFEWRHRGNSPTDRSKMSVSLANLLFKKLRPPSAGETLYLVPDGPLHLLPMAVLARQALPGRQPGSIRIATALAAILEDGVTDGSRADRLIAVIADPIYSADDARIRDAAATPPAIPDSLLLTRSARHSARIKRLPSTAVEANAIKSLVGDRGQLLTLLGADANRKSLTEANLDRFRIVHFATHAFADSEDPALAMLALSRYDRDGNPLDGDLRSFDISQLHFNAELVVLSACETALGREIAGEAPLGLAHAFLESGAKSVLATLWQVPDTSTARLMEEFYRQMLVVGMPASTALELAQLHIQRQPRWSDPYFWAGFQLISNARIEAGNKNVEGRGG